MKTSLNIDDHLFQEAKKEASRTGKTVSELISYWALKGREKLMKNEKKKTFKPLDLGRQEIDLSNRQSWMEELE